MTYIYQGPWTLVDAGGPGGRTITWRPTLQTGIRKAGGNRVDREVVNDNELVTSRKPADISAFNGKMIGEFGEVRHQEQASR